MLQFYKFFVYIIKKCRLWSLPPPAMTPAEVRLLLSNDFAFNDSIVYDENEQERIPNETRIWGSIMWLQPPTSKIRPWLKRAVEESKTKIVVCLIPARTNTEYFHTLVLPNTSRLMFIRGRLTFPGHKKQSPYASVVAVFGGAKNKAKSESFS